MKLSMKALKKLPKWLCIVVPVLFIGLALFLFLFFKGNNKDTARAGDQNGSSGNSLSVGDSSASNSSSVAPQDILAQWKADPKYQNPLTGIAYDELFRNSAKYKGQFVHFTGEVIQVLGDSGNWNLRVNVTQKGDAPYTYWEDTVFVFSLSPDRVIENDIIDFTAQADGVTTYKSTLGGDITIPSLIIYEQKVIGRAN
jgi:hypothetical protein